MEVCLQHCTVSIDGDEEVSSIAVLAVVDGNDLCPVGFHSEEIAYGDSVKNYD